MAVVEGAAREVAAPAGLRLVRAPGSGDDALAAEAREAGEPLLVVTADRGLRARLPAGTAVAGPGLAARAAAEWGRRDRVGHDP